LVDIEPSSPRGGVLKWNMYIACVACRIKVLGYMEDLESSYIFAEFLYLYQLTLHPSPNTPLILTGRLRRFYQVEKSRGKSFTESSGKNTAVRKIILKNHMNLL
jgi:hypothetical protein